MSGQMLSYVPSVPTFPQAAMLSDPQRFNLYSYVRNNPLRYIDPTGEEIELTGETDKERKKQLEAIQKAVGNAGSRLTYGLDEKTGKYLVQIKGDVKSFAAMNEAAAGLPRLSDILRSQSSPMLPDTRTSR